VLAIVCLRRPNSIPQPLRLRLSAGVFNKTGHFVVDGGREQPDLLGPVATQQGMLRQIKIRLAMLLLVLLRVRVFRRRKIFPQV
jgi:predicted benzoate:H+ symporter BenE